MSGYFDRAQGQWYPIDDEPKTHSCIVCKDDYDDEDFETVNDQLVFRGDLDEKTLTAVDNASPDNKEDIAWVCKDCLKQIKETTL